MGKLQRLTARFDEMGRYAMEELGFSRSRLMIDYLWAYVNHRCTIADYFLYRFYLLNRRGRREFVTLFDMRDIHRKNSQAVFHEFEEKDRFLEAFAPFIHRDWIGRVFRSSRQEFDAFADAHPHCILKPRTESGGEGVELCTITPENREQVWQRLVKDDYIAESLLKQCHEMAALHPGSVNTVRALTIRGRLVSAVLRMGVGGAFVDNGCSGGIFAGLDVDFEYLPGVLSDAYAAFLSRLRQILRPLGRFVWAALAPKTSAGQRGLLYEGHDYAALGAAVDAALLMTYEWGYTYGPPMAVAPLPNVRAVLDYAVTELPPAKILLGIPNYGYDWPLPFVQGQTRAQSISNQRAIELAIQYGIAIQYDGTAQAPYFHYTDGSGTVHEVWFEDARSLEVKLRLIAEYGFLGAGVWNIMRPFSQLWLVADGLYDIEAAF